MSKEITDPAQTDLSSAGYETILQNIHDAVYTLDGNGRITWVNEVAIEEHDTGYTREDLIGAPVTKLLSPEDITKCVDIITELVKNRDRESGRCEIAIQTADGREIECDLHLALLPFENGEFQGTVGVLRDITDRKRREQGRMVLNRVLRHNVRNRLNVVMGHAESLASDATNEIPSELEAIITAAEDLIQLSDKARQVDEALTADKTTLEPTEIVSTITQRCQYVQQQNDHVELTVKAPDTVWVRADYRVELLIDNLLENAIEHADRDTPTIDVSVHHASSDDTVELRVADDGPGIPTVEIQSLLHGEETSLIHGSGLGLWLVKWLTEWYGGDLQFDDRTPRGTVVTVRFPAASPPA